jgi:CRISPR-associated endonuclease/helicase Cas3
MPNFDLPGNNHNDLKSIFSLYEKPTELSDYKFFDNELFNRYKIKKIEGKTDIAILKQEIAKENSSVLVILNTISDTYDLYNEMMDLKGNYNDIVLLNTRFTLSDRKLKLQKVKNHLEAEQKVILITTMLIEAGVDIDFPVLYRDLCPIPSIVQSAGRCNRNGKLKNGKVLIFELCKEGKNRAELIYRGDDKKFLDYAREELNNKKLKKKELFNIQKNYFTSIKNDTIFGAHKSKLFEGGEIDFIDELRKFHFAEIGKFKLIEEDVYSKEKTYYIQHDDKDNNFSILKSLYEDLKNIEVNDYDKRKVCQIELKNQISKMSEHIVRLRFGGDKNLPLSEDTECCGIKLITKEYYNSETGIVIGVENSII